MNSPDLEKRASALYASAVARRLRLMKSARGYAATAANDQDVDVLVYDIWREAGETPEVLDRAFLLCAANPVRAAA